MAAAASSAAVAASVSQIRSLGVGGGANSWSRVASSQRACTARGAVRLSLVCVNRSRALFTATTVEAPSSPQNLVPAITLTEKALSHLKKLRADQSKDLCLRVGVRQGGCSGMSYLMDFEERSNIRPDDSIMEHEGFTMVCDPKSLLYLFGMQLDYSDALIGGGFSFKNPNATATCGCGKSFAA